MSAIRLGTPPSLLGDFYWQFAVRGHFEFFEGSPVNRIVHVTNLGNLRFGGSHRPLRCPIPP